MDDLSGLIFASSSQKQPQNGGNGGNNNSRPLASIQPSSSAGQKIGGNVSSNGLASSNNNSQSFGYDNSLSNKSALSINQSFAGIGANYSNGSFGTGAIPRATATNPSSLPLQPAMTLNPSPSNIPGSLGSSQSQAVKKESNGDAFGNLVSFGGGSATPKVDLSKLSLAEQAQLQQKSRNQPTNSIPSSQSQQSFTISTLSVSPSAISPSKTNANSVANISQPATKAPQSSTGSGVQWNFDAMFSGAQPQNYHEEPQGIQQASKTQPVSVSDGTDALLDFLSSPPASKPSQSQPEPALAQQMTPSKPSSQLSSPITKETEIAYSTTPSPSTTQTRSSGPTQANLQANQFPSKSDSNSPSLDENLAKLIDIGFGPEEARSALEQSSNNFNGAVDILLNGKKGNGNKSIPHTSSDTASRISKLTGLSAKNAEKAGQLLSTASEVGFGLLTKAKMLVAESSKKISSVMDERMKRGGQSTDFRRGSDGSLEIPDGAVKLSSNDNSPENSRPASREAYHSRPNSTKVIPPEPPKPKKKQRLTPPISCSPEILNQVSVIKEQGNTFFKQGQYGDAEEKYSQAIQCLPENHLSLIVLLNNRAGARLKTGNYKECVQDCNVVEMLCTSELDYEDVGLETVQEYRDSISKALLRKATALENMEKWDEAKQDYRRSLELNPNAKGAAEGIRRCNKATDPNLKAAIEKESAPGPDTGLLDTFGGNNATPIKNPNAIASHNQSPSNPLQDLSFMAAAPSLQSNSDNAEFKSERVEALRAQDAKKSQDEEERIRVKDSVDAQLMSWKRGKEANIRALIASLDQILWSSMKADWKPVNMSELVTPSQVKIRYMKAIAKLHPDKLSSMTLSVEEKLLANGIFSSLNDAWDSFKLQNNIK